jgi:NADH dehydrogenase FAD-containing subunit
LSNAGPLFFFHPPSINNKTFGIPSIQEGNGIFFLKQLAHARGIRNNIVDCFEKAAVPTVTDAERKRLLSFVVVGGGPTSCEFTSELHGTSKENELKSVDLLEWNGVQTIYVQQLRLLPAPCG